MTTRLVRRGSAALRPAAALAVFGTLLAGCAPAERAVAPDLQPGGPRLNVSAAALPAVRISEIHYDNFGLDAGEAVEVSFPVGTNLTGWRIVRFNGSSPSAAVVYTTPATAVGSSDILANLTPTVCDARAVVVVRYPQDGLQNGTADGIALVNGTQVVELLSWEGTFTVSAAAAYAAGQTSTDIGIAQTGDATLDPVGASLQRSGAGTWARTAANSFGSCNDADGVPPAVVATVAVTPPSAATTVGNTTTLAATARDASSQTIPGVSFTWTTSAPAIATVSSTGVVTGVAVGSATITATAPNGVAGTATVNVSAATGGSATNVRLSELHYDNDGTDVGEMVELEGDASGSLAGWSIAFYNRTSGSTSAQVYYTLPLTGTFGTACGTRGVLTFAVPASPGIQNGASDGLAIVNAAGQVVELLSYEGSFTATEGPAAGMTATDIGVDEDPAPPTGRSLQRAGNGVWFGPATSTFGQCNPATPPAAPSGVILEGYSFRGTDPIPVGFGELYRFKDVTTNSFIRTGLTWESSAPAVATVDALGNVTAKSVGSATITATETATGRTASTTVTTTSFSYSDLSVYADELQFGTPTDATPSDDYLVNRETFAASWNATRGQPNWVAYNLESTHRVAGADRCDCFIQDPYLPAAFPLITSADYDGSSYSRGHMTMSADRTRGALDNATTFYFSNIIPQTSQNNAGPWLALEQYLGDLAVSQNKEIFIFAGGAAYSGTLNNAGRVAIPTRTWKVAVILDRNEGISDVASPADVEIIAVDMPNSTSMPSSDWRTYRVTIDQIEALTGYDLLSALPDVLEGIIESGDRAPTAAISGPATGSEGTPVTFTSTSTDPDVTAGVLGDVLSFLWTVDGEPAGIQSSVTRTFVDNGTYTVRLIVSDRFGWADTATTSITVANAAPVVDAFAGATILRGETYATAGSFTDPGADSWTATVDYGDGSGVQPLALSGKGFALSHRYATAGSYTVTVTVRDDDTATGSRTATVVVETAVQGVGNLADLVQQLGANASIPRAEANSLAAKLRASAQLLATHADRPAGIAVLEAFINEITALQQSGRLSAEKAAALIDYARRVIAAAGA